MTNVFFDFQRLWFAFCVTSFVNVLAHCVKYFVTTMLPRQKDEFGIVPSSSFCLLRCVGWRLTLYVIGRINKIGGFVYYIANIVGKNERNDCNVT